MPYTRINCKWIKDLNVRPETIKILKENIVKSWTLLVAIFLSDICPQARETKEKINKWDYIKLKCFCTPEEIINKIKTQPTEWGTIFIDSSDKRLISKMYKILTKLNTEKKTTNQPN